MKKFELINEIITPVGQDKIYTYAILNNIQKKKIGSVNIYKEKFEMAFYTNLKWFKNEANFKEFLNKGFGKYKDKILSTKDPESASSVLVNIAYDEYKTKAKESLNKKLEECFKMDLLGVDPKFLNWTKNEVQNVWMENKEFNKRWNQQAKILENKVNELGWNEVHKILEMSKEEIEVLKSKHFVESWVQGVKCDRDVMKEAFADYLTNTNKIQNLKNMSMDELKTIFVDVNVNLKDNRSLINVSLATDVVDYWKNCIKTYPDSKLKESNENEIVELIRIHGEDIINKNLKPEELEADINEAVKSLQPTIKAQGMGI